MTHLRRWNMWLNGLTIDCIKSCFVRTSVLKFELWTEWCSWQSSMVNHQEGNKGSKDTALMQSCFILIHSHFTTDLVFQPNWPIGRAAASLLSLLLFQQTKTLVHYFSLKPCTQISHNIKNNWWSCKRWLSDCNAMFSWELEQGLRIFSITDWIFSTMMEKSEGRP